MSGIALKWVAGIKIGNQTAKQLLQFLASHSFAKPGFYFSNKMLAAQLEVQDRSIRRAFKILVDKNLVIKEERFAKSGQQISSYFYLNIPDDFIEDFFDPCE